MHRDFILKNLLDRNARQGKVSHLPIHISFTDILQIKRSSKIVVITWWRHQIETFSALLAICVGNSPVPGEFPAQRPVTRGSLMFSLICVWINGWVNNREAGDLRRYRAPYDVTVMTQELQSFTRKSNTPSNVHISLRVLTNTLSTELWW